MNNNSNKKLKEFLEALELCADEYNSKIQKQKLLEESPIIREYNKLSFDLSLLAKRYDRLKDEYLKLYQSECNHPLWYFTSDDTDRFEGRQLWTCQCIKCGKYKTGHSREFFDKLLIEPGNNVGNEYLKLESQQIDEKDVVKTLTKKFNNQEGKY
jgi:hypothetical protein